MICLSCFTFVDFRDAFEDDDFNRAAHDLIASSSDEEGFDGKEGEEKKKRDERLNVLMQAAGLEQQEKDLEVISLQKYRGYNIYSGSKT